MLNDILLNEVLRDRAMDCSLFTCFFVTTTSWLCWLLTAHVLHWINSCRYWRIKLISNLRLIVLGFLDDKLFNDAVTAYTLKLISRCLFHLSLIGLGEFASRLQKVFLPLLKVVIRIIYCSSHLSSGCSFCQWLCKHNKQIVFKF